MSEEMDIFAKRLRYLRERKKNEDSKYTQGYVADLIGVARSTYTAYENGTKQPPIETVTKIADLFNVSTDYLVGRSNKPNTVPNDLPPLTEKDEKDIAKRMAKIKEDLKNADGLNFRGEPMSEEAIESLLEAIEYAERQTVRVNKKYTPKKYRKDNE
jgi:transcriptional regulator with XRE-family HTH domain